MSTTINLPVLLAQLPHLAKVTAAQQDSPKTQAEFSEALARQREEKDKSKVQEIDKKQRAKAVDDEHKQQARQQGGSQRDGHEPDPEEEPEAPAKTPWAGNIINIKI
jgi:hypothetical protein